MTKSTRRQFVKRSLAACAGAAALSLEEKALLAASNRPGTTPAASARPASAADSLPTGKIGDVSISRIICGGNLIGGYAHSRDLIYVSSLLKNYFTEEKILETLEICEANGINTIITSTGSAAILKRYREERGGEMQWIAQCVPKPTDLEGDVKKAVDHGAVGAFLIGNLGDEWSRAAKIDWIGKVIECAKRQGVIAGVAGHELRTPMFCEKEGLDPDFYMKTFHSTKYWSTRRPDQQRDVIDNYAIDNYWDKEPEKTAAFMKEMKRPWIAYKVLAAGAIHPSEGFRHAFENGADFCCVGMFDFQVVEDAVIARKILSGKLDRERPWRS